MFAAFNRHNVSAPLLLLLLFCRTPFAPAQPAPPNAGVSAIKVTARLVVLDVVVTDAGGKPVDNLTGKDFKVYEDGRQQTIRSIEPPSAHVLPPGGETAGAAEVFDPARPENFGLSPVNVILLDEANTHFADSSFARREIRDYLSRQPAVLSQPTSLLSIYDNNFRELRGFTRDRDALLQALAAAPTQYAWKLEINGSTEDGPVERLNQSLRALNTIAQDYARIRGRKNLIWVGGGFPTLDPTSIDGDDAQEVKNALRHVTDVLLDTRVTLYAVDPTSSAVGLTEITDPTQLEFAIAAGDSLTAGSDPFNASNDFDNLGPVTGGRVVRGRNDVSAQLAQAIDLGTHFYTISYTPDSTSETAASYRKIRVVCTNPALTATTRTGYYTNSAQLERSTDTAAYDLATAAESSLPLNGLRVLVEPDDSPGAGQNSFLVRVKAADLVWQTRSDGSSTASVYILAGALNSHHELGGRAVEAMTATAKPGTDLRDPSHFADFKVTTPGHLKAPMLRFVVRDSISGRIGAADLPLTTIH
jgi:VWFA-related protein